MRSHKWCVIYWCVKHKMQQCIPARLWNPSLQHSPALSCHPNHDVYRRLLLISVRHNDAGVNQMDKQSKHIFTWWWRYDSIQTYIRIQAHIHSCILYTHAPVHIHTYTHMQMHTWFMHTDSYIHTYIHTWLAMDFLSGMRYLLCGVVFAVFIFICFFFVFNNSSLCSLPQ